MAEAERKIDVVWEEPPATPTRARYDWGWVADQLRSRPRVWAKVFDDDRTSLVNAIRQGKVPDLDPAKGFQVRTRNNVRYPVRRCTLYMRYIPSDGKE